MSRARRRLFARIALLIGLVIGAVFFFGLSATGLVPTGHR